MSRFHAFFSWSAILLLAGPLSGCKEDPPGKVVEEDGVWSLIRYNIDGEGELLNSGTQKDAFLLKFEESEHVVTTAACGMAMEDNTPGSSVCRQNPSITGWLCHCFSYAYEEDRMQWREFAAGDPPPRIDFEEPNDGGGGEVGSGSGSGGDSGGGGGDSYLTISANVTPPDTYAFTPMPVGVFGSDGDADRFEFVQRAASVFDGPADDDNAPATDPEFACTPCI